MPPDRSAFAAVWQALGTLLEDAPLHQLTRDAWGGLDLVIAPRGYPTVRHSAAHRAAHASAYGCLAQSKESA